MARNKEFVPEKALDAALQLFWTRGYEATSMQELVDCTGLSRSSLYDTFGDKHTLFLAALDKYQRGENVAMCERMSDSSSPKAAIERLFAALVERIQQADAPRGCFMLTAMLELGAHDPAVAERANAALQAGEQLLTALIACGQALGEINQRLSAQILARHLLNAIRGLQALAKIQPAPAHLQEVVTATLALLEP